MCTSTHIPGKVFTIFRIALRSNRPITGPVVSYPGTCTVHRVPGLADVRKRNMSFILWWTSVREVGKKNGPKGAMEYHSECSARDRLQLFFMEVFSIVLKMCRP